MTDVIEAERNMFGATMTELELEFGKKDLIDKLMAAMSILSDTQEGIARLDVRGRQDRLRLETARKRINVAKWLICEVKTTMRKSET